MRKHGGSGPRLRAAQGYGPLGVIQVGGPLGPLSATVPSNSGRGDFAFDITGLYPGETISSVTPNDGCYFPDATGTALVIGSTASVDGSLQYVIWTSAGRQLPIVITVGGGVSVDLPVNLTAPQIVGAHVVGAKITFDNGLWLGSPTSFEYVLKRNGIVVPQTGDYTLTSADLAPNSLTLEVTGINNVGPSASPGISAAINDVTAAIVLPTSPAGQGTNIGTLDSNGPRDSGLLQTNSLNQQVEWTVPSADFFPYTYVAMHNPGTGASIGFGFFERRIQQGNVTPGAAGAAGQYQDLPIGVIKAGSKIRVTALSNGDCYVAIDGVEVADTRYNLGVPANDATKLSIYMQAYAIHDVTYGALSTPVSIDTVEILADGRPRVSLRYEAPTVAPTGFGLRATSINGAVEILPLAAGSVISSSGAGQATVDGAVPIPQNWRGGTFNIQVVQANNTANTFAKSVTYPAPKRMGLNISPVSYADWQNGVFRDWFKRLPWAITGGSYDNGGYANTGPNGDANMQALWEVGDLLNEDMSLKKWPDGATNVQTGTINYPAIYETGDRTIEVGKRMIIRAIGPCVGTGTNQGVQITGRDTSNPDYDVVTINFSIPAGNADQVNPSFIDWRIELDQASFVPGFPKNFKKAGDTGTSSFTDQYLAAIGHLQGVRFLDIFGANNGGVWETFANRLNYNWSPQHVVELINTLLVVPEFPIGYNVTAENVADWAAYFEQNIDPRVPHILYEAINEPWNQGFPAAGVMGYRAAINGRATNAGHGAPIDPAMIHNPVPVDGQASPGSGGPIGISVPAGHYVFQGIGGFSYHSLFQAKHAVGPTATLPNTKGSDGFLVENSDFTPVNGGWLDEGAAYEMGAFGIEMQDAVMPVSPRARFFLNLNPGDIIQVGDVKGINGRTILDYVPDLNDGRCLGDIIHGITVNGYIDLYKFQGDGVTLTPQYAAISTASAGAARIAAMTAQINPMLASVDVSAARTGIINYFAARDRASAPMFTIYEDGLNFGSWNESEFPGIFADWNAYFHLSTTVDALAGAYNRYFDQGAQYQFIFNMGPNNVSKLTGIGSDGYWPNYESIDDTHGRTAAIIRVGDACAAALAA